MESQAVIILVSPWLGGAVGHQATNCASKAIRYSS
jgi:hypothetical protein